MLTFTTLASGSSGNAALVSCGDTHVLLDAGVSARRITSGLAELGVAPGDLSAVLVTHGHSDHVAGLRVLAKKLAAPICATGETCRALERAGVCGEGAGLLSPREAGRGFPVGALWVEPFSTPHDAPGSVGYSIAAGDFRMVLCTDLGHVTREVERAVRGCDLLVCETNHDEDWLRSGPYPYHLKARILGDFGHLSNEAGAQLAAMAVRSGTRAVVLAHLSAENNTPARAHQAVCRRLREMGCDPERDVAIAVAPRSQPGRTWRLARGADVRRSGEREAALC